MAQRKTGQGYQWADQICNTARNLCEHPIGASPYARRHCILPIDGFFEWKAISNRSMRYCPARAACRAGEAEDVADRGDLPEGIGAREA
jgi:hypothetical protein